MSTDGNDELLRAMMPVSASEALEFHKRQKSHRRNQVVAAINSAVETWTGTPPNAKGLIPIVRNKELLGYSGFGRSFGANPVNEVASKVFALGKKDLEARIKAFGLMDDALAAFLDQISELDADTLTLLNRSIQALSPAPSTLQDKNLFSIGFLRACISSAGKTRQGLKRLQEDATENQKGMNTRGAPRIESRYALAKGLAEIFALALGETPTFSKGKDGLSGKFTPQLKDVFIAAGWDEADLSAPCKAAIDSLCEHHFEVPTSVRLGAFRWWAKK